jgi:hypothetical protein
MTDSGLLPAEPPPATPPVGQGPALNGEVIAQPAGNGAATAPTSVGQAGVAGVQALADNAAAPTPRAYQADWAHYAAWCAQAGFTPVPADPAAVGAYLTSLGETLAPSTIRRRLSAIGKMHRVNDLPWDPSHRAIQEPLQAVLRTRGRPVQKPAAVSFGHGTAFGLSFEGRAILMGIACFCLLLLLSTLFWMLLKGAVVLAAFLYFVTRFSARGTGPSTPNSARIEAASSAARAFGAVRMPAFRLVAVGTLVAAVYVGAGVAGLTLGLGVCLGVFLAVFFRTRRLPWL